MCEEWEGYYSAYMINDRQPCTTPYSCEDQFATLSPFPLFHSPGSTLYPSCLNASSTYTPLAVKNTRPPLTLIALRNPGLGDMDLSLLADLRLPELLAPKVGGAGEGLETPPIGSSELQAYYQHSTGLDEDDVFDPESNPRDLLLDPASEDSVNLRDLIATFGQDDVYRTLLTFDKGLGACQADAKGELSGEGQLYCEGEDGGCVGDDSPLIYATEEALLQLQPPSEQELGVEDVCVEQQLGAERLNTDVGAVTSDLHNSVLTLSAEDLAALGSCFLLQAPPTDPQEEDLTSDLYAGKELTSDLCAGEELTPEPHPLVGARQGGRGSSKGRRESFKAPPALSGGGRGRKDATTPRQRNNSAFGKESDEYRDKRERNNASVRKSRDKARQRQEETEGRLETLSSENRRLQERVDSLEQELSILRGLFSNVGAAVPREVDGYLGARSGGGRGK